MQLGKTLKICLKVTVKKKKSINIYFIAEFNPVVLEFTIHNCICTKQEYLTEQQIIIKYCQVFEFQINSHKYFLGETGIRKQNPSKDNLTYISSHFLRV